MRITHTRQIPVMFIRAGLVTAIVDGLFSSVLSVAFYGSTVTRLFQGVAATLLGSQALEGGTPAALIGVLMHLGSGRQETLVMAAAPAPLNVKR
jgi:hypothetical protein